MISPLLFMYLKKREYQLKINMPKNKKQILNQYRNINGNCILFSWLFNHDTKTLNASALFYKLILISPEWAVRLVLFDDEETKNAFKITLGHELTHKDGDYFKLLSFGKNKKFINYVNEIHADFGAAAKTVDSDRKKLIASMNYKLSLKANDKNTSDHPSWNTRKYYAENYNFNKELIERIAKDVGCNNKDLIEKVCEYYNSDIILN